jgi:hypothetical protein
MRFTTWPILLSLVALSSPLAYASGGKYGLSLALGFPHILNLMGDLRSDEKWSYGLALGGTNIPLKNKKGADSGIRIGEANVDFRVRCHPFNGAFFLGGMLGFQALSAIMNKDIVINGAAIPTNVTLKVTSPYFTPHLGWLWVFETGFLISFEMGVQVPFGAKSVFESSIDDPVLGYLLAVVKTTKAYADLESDAETTANKVGRITFPYFTALKLGWAF